MAEILEGTKEEGSWRFRRERVRGGVHFFASSVSTGFSWLLLVLFLVIAYAPYLGSRVVRSAGDDKVYVSQAIEMAERGAWFTQTLGGEPNYYKGPLHYIFLRLGMMLFGTSMWATVWMNLFLLLIAAVLLGRVVQKNMREFPGWPFFAALAFGLNAGIYSHVFASQMEVETACFMAIGLYFLDKASPGKGDLRFWIVCGLTGWLKSPLHSVLLGACAIGFWAWNRELWARVKSPQAWAAAVFGVAICAAGYAPAYFLDRDNFVATYIYRETLDKPPNGSKWHYPVLPFFTYFLMPWMLPALVAYYDGLSRFWRRSRPIRSTPGSRRVVALGVCLVVPSVAFFIWHPYRGQNYNLPVIGGLVLVVTSLWASRSATWNKYYEMALGFTALLFVALVAGLTYLLRHYDPLPYWWNTWRLPILWVGFLLAARGFWREGVTLHTLRPDSLSRRSLWLFLALGGLLMDLGEREMRDVRDRIYQAQKTNEKLTMSYYNLQKNIWSEWGYLNFMIPYPVKGLFSEAQLREAVLRGDLILVPGDEWLEDMRAKLEKDFPPATWKIEPWKRWKTKGKNAAGVPAWQESWETRDLTKLEKDFYMVKIPLVGK